MSIVIILHIFGRFVKCRRIFIVRAYDIGCASLGAVYNDDVRIVVNQGDLNPRSI